MSSKGNFSLGVSTTEFITADSVIPVVDITAKMQSGDQKLFKLSVLPTKPECIDSTWLVEETEVTLSASVDG